MAEARQHDGHWVDAKAFLVFVFWSGRPGGSYDRRKTTGGCQEVSILRVLGQ